LLIIVTVGEALPLELSVTPTVDGRQQSTRQIETGGGVAEGRRTSLARRRTT